MAEEVATTIKKGIPIDVEEIEAEDVRISEKVQVLAERTDLGELIAKYDKTTEGREKISMLTGVVGIVMVTAGVVIYWNVFLVGWNIFLFFRCLPEKTRKLGHEVKNKMQEVKGMGHDLSDKLKVVSRTGKFQKR